MKHTRFNETQIRSILKEADSGIKVKDLCRKHGISHVYNKFPNSTVVLSWGEGQDLSHELRVALLVPRSAAAKRGT